MPLIFPTINNVFIEKIMNYVQYNILNRQFICFFPLFYFSIILSHFGVLFMQRIKDEERVLMSLIKLCHTGTVSTCRFYYLFYFILFYFYCRPSLYRFQKHNFVTSYLGFRNKRFS